MLSSARPAKLNPAHGAPDQAPATSAVYCPMTILAIQRSRLLPRYVACSSHIVRFLVSLPRRQHLHWGYRSHQADCLHYVTVPEIQRKGLGHAVCHRWLRLWADCGRSNWHSDDAGAHTKDAKTTTPLASPRTICTCSMQSSTTLKESNCTLTDNGISHDTHRISGGTLTIGSCLPTGLGPPRELDV